MADRQLSTELGGAVIFHCRGEENRVTIRIDPEGNETFALFGLVNLSGQHVLEIGSGDGQLTWRFAGWAAHVTALEFD